VSEYQVLAFIRSVIKSLTPDFFVETRAQEYATKAIPADVYAVANTEGRWYVKFWIEGERMTVCSCHAPKHDMKRVDGKIIKKVDP